MNALISAQSKKGILAVVLTFSFTDMAFAAVQTVTLAVPSMDNCEICPITVRKALEKVPGVSRVSVSFKNREAVVTYDNAKTAIQTLEHATFEAGYASTVETSNKQGVAQ